MSSDEARAWGRYANRVGVPKPLPGTQDWNTERIAFTAGHRAGVEWQRTRPVTDAEVEAAARAAYENAFLKHAPEDVDRWDDLVTDNDPAAESWRQVARAALEAARKVEQ